MGSQLHERALNERTLRNHDTLASECGELTRALCGSGSDLAWRLDRSSARVPRFFADFPYPISSWPLLVSADTRERFMTVVRAVPSLIFRAVHRYYRDDRARLQERYGLPAFAYDRLLDPAEARNMLIRCDFVLVEGTPKLLEVNVGSRAGGWQIDCFWPQLAGFVNDRREWREWKLSHVNTLDAFSRYMHRSARTHLGDAASGRILLILAPYFMEHHFDEELAAIYQQAMSGVANAGVLLFDVGIDDVTISGDGAVKYRGEAIDAIMATSEHVTPPPAFSEAHLRKQLFFPDNALHMLATDKTHLAILHLARAAGWLDEEDARFVDEYVPWSAFLTADAVEWNGDMVYPRDLALANRDHWVLKRGLSCQGQDVFVGSFLPDEEWAAAVDRAGMDGDWIIQAYCPPDRLYAPDDESGVAEHDAVWGVFGLGQEYGGMFGRLIAPHCSRGVVNVSRGAKMSLVLEV